MKIGIIGIGFVGNAIMKFFEKKNKKKNLLLYDKYKNGGIGSFTDILDNHICTINIEI